MHTNLGLVGVACEIFVKEKNQHVQWFRCCDVVFLNFGTHDAVYKIKKIKKRGKREDVMRTTINTIIATLATTTTAFAANGAAEEPGILAWAFMGFCAVILVGQLVPAAMLVIGAVKGLATAPKEVKNH
jgi:hypothetical protein